MASFGKIRGLILDKSTWKNSQETPEEAVVGAWSVETGPQWGGWKLGARWHMGVALCVCVCEHGCFVRVHLHGCVCIWMGVCMCVHLHACVCVCA